MPADQFGLSYDQSLSATGGIGPYTWSVALGSLPSGLKLSSSGLISGTPTAPGTFGFSVKATDSSTPTSFSATQALSITVTAAPLKITVEPGHGLWRRRAGHYPHLRRVRERRYGRVADRSSDLLYHRHQLLAGGNYTSTCSGAFDPNYQISYVNGSVSVGTALLTITANSATIDLRREVPVITAMYGGFANGDSAASLRTPPTCSTSATSSSPTGTYPAICSGAVDPNYAIGYTAGTVTVIPAPLTITAPANASMTEGGPVPAITPTYGGLVNGDSAASLSTAPPLPLRDELVAARRLPGYLHRGRRLQYAITYLAGAVTVNPASSGVTPGTPTPGTPTPGTPTPGTPPPGTPAGAPTPAAFPQAWLSYPNGAVVSFGAKDYVFAGGRAFIATGNSFGAVEKVDHARVISAPSGAIAPTGVAPRSGTLLTTRPVTGNSIIYVAGPDGQLHGFSTSGQFSRDGYDAALVVTVPNLGDVSIGSTAGVEGAAANALVYPGPTGGRQLCRRDYVFAGGRAFGVSSPAHWPSYGPPTGPGRSAAPLAPLKRRRSSPAGAAHGLGTSVRELSGCSLPLQEHRPARR